MPPIVALHGFVRGKSVAIKLYLFQTHRETSQQPVKKKKKRVCVYGGPGSNQEKRFWCCSLFGPRTKYKTKEEIAEWLAAVRHVDGLGGVHVSAVARH